jgi:hypothetical protein
VKLGSLRFLESDRRRLRSFRWQHRLLLALRCALLAALALLLSGLSWKPAAPAPVRWLLTVPGTTLDSAAQADWDRLRTEGFSVHPPSVVAPDTEGPEFLASPFDAWSRFREFDASLPSGSRVVVFGPPLARYFSGPRPTLSRAEVTWRATAAPATVDAIPVQPTAPRARVIAARDRVDDARFVRAMLQALHVELSDEKPDWIFVLGHAPLLPGLLQQVQPGGHLVTDAPETVPVLPVHRTFAAGNRVLRLHQRVALQEGSPLLLDSGGDPVLTTAPLGRGTQWRFAMRFLPEWSDWPLSSAFPEWWQQPFGRDRLPPLRVAAEQAAPRHTPEPTATPPALSDFRLLDGRFICWVLAVALFLLERLLSRVVPRQGEAS